VAAVPKVPPRKLKKNKTWCGRDAITNHFSRPSHAGINIIIFIQMSLTSFERQSYDVITITSDTEGISVLKVLLI
jgi:hypothetical protein